MKQAKIIVAILISLVFAGGFVSAFVLFDPPLKWKVTPRNIAINQSGNSSVNSSNGDGGVTEIRAAVDAAWNGAGAGNVVSTTAVANPPYVIGDGISTMHFNVGGTGCSGSCLAVTLTQIPNGQFGGETFNGVNFEYMGDSDIFFNTRTKFYSSFEADGCRREIHIESVAVHEVGHLLGLGHTSVSGATMYPSTGQCSEIGETLAQDDADGINCLYNSSADCGQCVPSTLEVDSTNCDQPTSGGNAGDFVVETFIVDNCGGAVAGADVTIDIPTSPSGPLSCSGQTSSTGRLGCALDNPPDGLYESLVASVSKAGLSWPGNECGGVGQPPCGCSIEIGGGGGNDCGNGTCDAGESCDGRNGTVSCPADCDGKTNGKPSTRYCFVGGNCEGPGCP